MKKLIIFVMLRFSILEVSLAQDQTTFILIRHAEKGTDDARNPSLSEIGEKRAEKLKDLLAPMSVSAIYSTPFKRTRQTVAPLATSHNLDVQDYDYQNKNLLQELMAANEGGIIVISGHSNTTPVLVNQLIGEEKYEWLKEEEYDKVFIVTASQVGNGKVHILSY